MPRYEFPNHASFDGDVVIETGAVSVYLTSVDSLYVFETGPLYDRQLGRVTNELGTFSFLEFDKLGRWLNDDEMARAEARLAELRRLRGDA